MAEQDRIYVDGSLPATFWRSLKGGHKIRATIKLIGGRVFTATDVDRIRYGNRQ
jgi:hypothetical protein